MARKETALSSMQAEMTDVKKILFENFCLTQGNNSKKLADNAAVVDRLEKHTLAQYTKIASVK